MKPDRRVLLASILGLFCGSPVAAQSIDPDGDGVLGFADRCPGVPETLNGFDDDDGCPDSFDDLFELVVRDLGEFWEGQMSSGDQQYVPPSRVVLYDDFALTPCGSRLAPNNAYYSTCRHGVYFHRPFMEDLFAQDDWIPAVVAAHEWGHLAQYTKGFFSILPKGMFRELHADCYAGAYTRFVQDSLSRNLRLSPGDIEAALLGLFRSGDTFLPWLHPQFHGTGGERMDAFYWGFNRRTSGCDGSVFLSRFGRNVDRRGLAIPEGPVNTIFPDPALGPYQLLDCYRLRKLIGSGGTTDAIRCDYEGPQGQRVAYSLMTRITAAGATELLQHNRQSLLDQGWSVLGEGDLLDDEGIGGRHLLMRHVGTDVFMFASGRLFGYLHGPAADIETSLSLLFPAP